MTMKGILFTKGNAPKLFNDLQRPTPNAGEEIIRLAYTGVCGTDLHIIKGEFITDKSEKLILGHEMTGYREDGSKVCVNPNGSCGFCQWCQRGAVHFCKRALSTGGIGLARDGGWAEYVSAPKNQLQALPKAIPMDAAALTEPVSCIMRGLERIDENNLQQGTKVLIIGAGIIGLLWACILHNKGLRKLTISEPSEERRKLVENMAMGLRGCKPDELDETYDVIIDCSGNTRAIEGAFQHIAKGGVLCIFGCAPEGAKLKLPYARVGVDEIRVVLCRVNPYTTPKAVEMVETLYYSGYLNFHKLGIRTLTLEEHEEALQLLEKRACSKVMFKIAG